MRTSGLGCYAGACAKFGQFHNVGSVGCTIEPKWERYPDEYEWPKACVLPPGHEGGCMAGEAARGQFH